MDFVILGDYSFLYCDYNVKPPEKLPLWFHESVTFDKESDFEDIKSYFSETRPNLVLEQMIVPSSTRDEFGEHLLTLGYEKIDELSTAFSLIRVYQLENETSSQLR